MRNVFLSTTKKRFGFFEYGKGLFLFLLMSACFASSIPAGESGVACPTKEEIIQKTGVIQMPFIANNGQVDEQVKFYAKTFGGTVFVTKEGEIVYTLPGSEKAEYGFIVASYDTTRCFSSHLSRSQAPQTVPNEFYIDAMENSAFTPSLPRSIN